jgi:O-antigen ligase
MSSIKISKVTGYLLMLFAICVLCTQSGSDLFSTLLCFFLAYVWYDKRKAGEKFSALRPMGFDWLWIAWFLVAAIGFAANRPPPAETPENYWLYRLVEYKWILILYFMVAGFRVANFKEENMKWFNGAMLVATIYAIADYFWQLRSVDDPTQVRLEGLINFSMTYAHVYGVFFCALVGLYFGVFKDLSKQKKWFYLLVIVLTGVSVLLTYTRGVWIAVFASLVIISFLWKPKYGIAAIVAGILAVAALYATVPTIRSRIDFTARMADEEKAKSSYDTERVILWKTNLMIFKDRPFFGAGYGQNKHLLHEYYEKQNLPKDQFVSHAHNQYIHLLAGTGALGLLSYLGVLGTFIVLTFRAFMKIPKSDGFHKGLALGVLGGQLCFAIGGITESNFEHSIVRFAAMFMWAMGLWLWTDVANTKS